MCKETHLKTILELLADKVKDDGIDAGVDGGQVYGEIVQDQEEAKKWDFINQLSPTFEINIF